MRINRKSQACLPAYTTKDRRAPKFLDLKNRRSRSCATGAYSVYVRMAHERDRRFLWLKATEAAPPLTNTRAHKPTIHAFRRWRTSQTPRKLPPRTPEPKIPNASPKGMHPHEQHKNVPNKNKQTRLKRKRYELPTTLNTTAKDKAQNAT